MRSITLYALWTANRDGVSFHPTISAAHTYARQHALKRGFEIEPFQVDRSADGICDAMNNALATPALGLRRP